MSYQKMLTDRSDVFHIKSEAAPTKYGVPSVDKAKVYNYPEVADLTNVPCLFTKAGGFSSYLQGEPNRSINEQWLVHFMPNVDIRLNDKVIKDGVEYRLQTPRKVRNHHWEVIAVREGSL